MTGIDVSPRAVDRATDRAARAAVSSVSFLVHDVLRSPCPPCDVAVSSLFLHHLDDAPAAQVLRGMATAARAGGIVSDLVRSRCGLLLAYLATYVLTTSRVARADGPRSVRAARTLDEYRALVAQAGLEPARIRRAWPQRVVIEWHADAAGGRS